MFKNIAEFFLTFCIILLNLCFQVSYNLHEFNASSVKKNIELYSSDKYKGRLAGTLENEEIAQIIKKDFINTGLKSFSNNYYESFPVSYPHRTSGEPFLKVTDNKGNTIKEFKYNSDYKEDMLNFRTNTIKFNKYSHYNYSSGILQVFDNNNSFIFYAPDNDQLGFRSSFMSDSKNSMYIIATSKTLSDIMDFISRGYTINCYIPFSTQKTTINNVIGCIEGKDKKSPPLILSAHFDHLGTDLSGNVYNGALDNASGISFVIEMSKYIKSMGTPDRDIIFAAFNAEEFGCLGSTYFVENNDKLLHNSKVFNFDMIGSDNSVPLCIMGGKKDSLNTPFLKSVSSVCEKNHIFFNYLFEDSSDHEAFRKHGIDAITFCDNDKMRIHTPDDKSNYINTNSINRCFKVASEEVIKYAYGNNLILLYYKQILVSAFACLIVLSLIYRKIGSSKDEII